MKTKVLLILSICCFLISASLVVGLSGSLGAQPGDVPSREGELPVIYGDKLPNRNGNGTPLHHKAIPGFFTINHLGELECLSTHNIYNASFKESITLGPVWVVTKDGLAGEVYCCNGLVGKKIPPLGSYSFNLDKVCMEPSCVMEPPQDSFVVVISWVGKKEACRINGISTQYRQQRATSAVGLAEF